MQEQDTTPEPAPDAPSAAPELPGPTAAALELEELQRQLDQSKDLLLRKAAEFENFKRRTENDFAMIAQRATEEILRGILPVLDDLERSLKAARTAPDAASIVKGIELIAQKLVRALDGAGVRSFETVGKEFNVDLHDALMMVPRADLPPHTVIEEVERGYMLNDRVIRHAKVVVSADQPATEN
jgi:molecular chaperone GrpE